MRYSNWMAWFLRDVKESKTGREGPSNMQKYISETMNVSHTHELRRHGYGCGGKWIAQLGISLIYLTQIIEISQINFVKSKFSNRQL